jgi:hypothetical protein
MSENKKSVKEIAVIIARGMTVQTKCAALP